MVARGVAAHDSYQKFLDLLSVRPASYATPAAPRKTTKTAGPDTLFGMTELRRLLASPVNLAALINGNPPLDRLSDLVAVLASPSPGVPQEVAMAPPLAAFQNRTATTPGKHGVPFLPSQTRTNTSPMPMSPPSPRSSPAQPSSVLPSTPPSPPPPVTAPRTDVVDFLRDNRVCFTHAFKGCTRTSCRWSHDVVAAGFYSALANRRNNTGNNAGRDTHRRLAAMTEEQYSLAVDIG
ncbi:unnamed protein product, partial [Pylaiella littoralis]